MRSVTLEIAGRSVELEIADTVRERSAGLSNRDSLEEGTGMLFVYARPAKPCFWMKETFIPLDAAFIDTEGEYVMVATMEPESLDPHCPLHSVKWVIEMPAGWFALNGVSPGSKVGRETMETLRSISSAAGLVE